MQRENSTSGVEGKPGIILNYNDQEMKINFACPYTGSNYFNVDNGIDGVTAEVEWSTPDGNESKSGHPVNASVKIKTS